MCIRDSSYAWIWGKYNSGSPLVGIAEASVAIGTGSPDHIFHVQDVGANSFNTKFVLDLEGTRNSGYTQATIELASEYGTGGSGNFRTSAIAAELISDQSATDIVFYNESTERMRLLSDGSLGIGTATPFSTTKLTLAGSIGLGLGNAAGSNATGVGGDAGSLVADGTARTLTQKVGAGTAAWMFVSGYTGSKGFADIVVQTAGGISIISSNNINGSPPARTYEK